VKRGELRISDAVREYRVPRTSLKNHVNGTNKVFKVGRKTTLTEDQEKLLLQVCFFLSDCALGLDDLSLALIVRNFVRMRNIKTPFKDDCPGSDWPQK
jgi:hypothetical protein